jgi:prepilin-type N-terminal cleavage/methylation domain-containing protein
MKPAKKKKSIELTSYRANQLQCGFSFLETIMVLAIIGIISLAAVPVYQDFQLRNDLDVAANTIAQSLRRAQVLSQAVDGDSSWGLNVATSSITVFRGSTYAGRNTNFDEVFTMHPRISVSGTSEITFSKVFGLPSASTSVVLTIPGGESRTIGINSKGTVNY